MRIPKDVFLHVLCSFFVFEHSLDDQLLSDGHVLLQLCKWSDADKAAIKRRMHHIRVLPLGFANHSSVRIAHCVRYEHDLSRGAIRCFVPRAPSPTTAVALFWDAARHWLCRRRPRTEKGTAHVIYWVKLGRNEPLLIRRPRYGKSL